MLRRSSLLGEAPLDTTSTRCLNDMNWERLKQQLPGAGAGSSKKRKRQAAPQEATLAAPSTSALASKQTALAAPAPAISDEPQLVSEALTPQIWSDVNSLTLMDLLTHAFALS